MNRAKSFLWISGWSIPAHTWDTQIAHWPDQIHRAIDFNQCESTQQIVSSAKEALITLPNPVRIIGSSLGAFVALELLKIASPSLEALYLTGIGSQFIHTRTYPHGWDKRVLRIMQKQLLADPQKVLTQFDQKLFFPAPVDPSWKEYIRKKSPSTSSLTTGLDYLIDFRFDPDIQPLRIPIYLLAGTSDQITPPGGTQHLHQLLTTSKLTIWNDQHHIPFQTHPNQFHRWLKGDCPA